MKIICIGRNYKDHIREFNNEIPEEPVFFLKPDSSLLIKNRPFYYPYFSEDVQYEAELVIRISRVGKNIKKEFAGSYFNAIGIGIDFTARDLQRKCIQKGLPWEIAKGFDRSAVISEEFRSKEKFPNVNNIEFRLELNGKTVQKGNTSNMVFSFDTLISYISKYMTLKTGDLIYTGTPSGVGPVKIGDRLKAYIGGDKYMDFRVK